MENNILVRYRNYSDNKKHFFKEHTENVSTIIDAMIRITAKVTEHYVGDIYYDIKSLSKAIEEKRPLNELLLFEEDGVRTLHCSDIDNHPDQYFSGRKFNRSYIQAWQLSHQPGDECHPPVTTFVRVYVTAIMPES